MPPYYSHLLQSLDVDIFAPLKRALSKETDILSQHNSNHISYISWVEMYIRARTKALSSENLKAGWKGAGLIPLDPNKILDKLPKRTDSTLTQPETPRNEVNLDLSLLNSSPPDGTQLREANKLLVSALEETAGLSDSVRRYTARLTTMAESTHAELITARKELESVKKILNTRKKRRKGKRVALEGKFVFLHKKS